MKENRAGKGYYLNFIVGGVLLVFLVIDFSSIIKEASKTSYLMPLGAGLIIIANFVLGFIKYKRAHPPKNPDKKGGVQ